MPRPYTLFTHNDPLMRSIEGIIKYLPLSEPPNPPLRSERGEKVPLHLERDLG